MRNSIEYRDKWGNIKYCNPHKMVAAARMERTFGHLPSPESIVHHKIRDKSDNRPSNLWGFLWVFRRQQEYKRVHRVDKKDTS
jgi:hypothetical protein